MSRKHFVWLLLAVVTAVLALLIVTDWVPYLRGPAPETAEWYWPYALRPASRWATAVFPAFLFGGLGWLWVTRRNLSRFANFWLMLSLVAVHMLWQVGIVYTDNPQVGQELVNRTLSHLSGGYFATAVESGESGWTPILQQFDTQMPTFGSEHARTHPPGLLLLNWAVVQASNGFPAVRDDLAALVWHWRCTDLWLLNRSPAVAAGLWLMSALPILAGALTLYPAYAVGRKLLPDVSQARLAAVLATAVPALLIFSPKVDQIFVPLALLALLALLQTLDHSARANWRKAAGWLAVCGLLISLLSYFSVGNLALLLPLAVLAGLEWLTERRSLGRGVALAGVMLVSVTAVWLVTWAAWGVPPWRIGQEALTQHYELVTLKRNYAWWLGWNLVDVLVYAGWPLVLGFVGFLLTIKSYVKQTANKRLVFLAVALLLLLAVLTVSGSARGEVGRIWLFFLPWLAFPAVGFFARLNLDESRHALLLTCHLLLTCALAIAWQPVRGVIVVAERPDMPLAIPSEATNTQFGDQLTLRGYRLASLETSTLNLLLFWEAEGPTTRPYTVFNHLLNDQGELVAQQDNWSLNGQWPTTCWQPGSQLIDQYHIPIPPDLPPGTYTLYTGLYDGRDQSRLPTSNGQTEIKLFDIDLE
ncbi:MAG: hypothetical protein KDD89_03265 [Anaerolineales bacterium]|nr:hypothetical protein [Anaerolineales bacterium]